jgi:hypothetical protein
MKKDFDSAEEALVFVAGLIEEQKWLILPAIEKDGMYIVEWIEHKSYTAMDGLEYPDEVWITEAGVPLLIQEMSEAHVRNTLRMILRNQREVEAGLSRMIDAMESGIFGGEVDTDLDSIPDETGNEADDETVRRLKVALTEHPDMVVPATAVKGPDTLH